MATTRKTSKKVADEAAEPVDSSFEDVGSEKASTGRKRSTRKTLSSLDPNELVELASRAEGRLIYVSTSGYTIEWSEFGDVHLVPVSEIIKMRNEQPSFFRNHWVYPVSDNADTIIEALQLSRYYNRLVDLKDFDEIFSYEPSQIAGVLKDCPKHMLENVARRASHLVDMGELDSISVIDAIEKATGFKIKDQS